MSKDDAESKDKKRPPVKFVGDWHQFGDGVMYCTAIPHEVLKRFVVPDAEEIGQNGDQHEGE